LLLKITVKNGVVPAIVVVETAVTGLADYVQPVAIKSAVNGFGTDIKCAVVLSVINDGFM